MKRAAPTNPNHIVKPTQKARFFPSPAGGLHTRESKRLSLDDGKGLVIDPVFRSLFLSVHVLA
jgi:hypothetical protein